MKTINGRNLFAILGLALLSACSSSTGPVNTTVSTAPQLFSLEPTQDRKTLQQTAQGYLATLLADPANAEVTFIKIDPALVSQQTQDLAVTLPDGKTAQFHLRKYNTITPGIDGWVGYKPSVWKQTHASSPSEIDNDPLFYISLARSGENIVGSVVVEGQTYRVQSVSPGQYVLIKIDESKLPPDGEPIQFAKSVAPDLPTATGSHSAISVIRLLFVTTNQVRDKRPNNRLELANAVNDVNNLMESSDVAIRFDLAGFYDANYDESSGDYWQQATSMMSNQQVMQRRDALRADLVSILSTKPELCGQASLNASKSNAFSIISCTGALGHEIGHNLGAMHHNGESGVPVYAYGYKDEVGNFHTQMRTSNGAVKYFANPRLSYQGRPLGTVDKNDVAKRFNERRETVENFYPPMPFRKIKNVMREASGVPACLMVTTRGDLGFTDCEGSSNDLPRRQWLYNSIPPAISIESRLGGDAACLQYTRKGSAPQLSGCPANISEAIKTHTDWYLILGTIQYNFLGISNCLTAGAGDTSPVFDFCKGGFDQQWRAVD